MKWWPEPIPPYERRYPQHLNGMAVQPKSELRVLQSCQRPPLDYWAWYWWLEGVEPPVTGLYGLGAKYWEAGTETRWEVLAGTSCVGDSVELGGRELAFAAVGSLGVSCVGDGVFGSASPSRYPRVLVWFHLTTLTTPSFDHLIP